VSFDEYDLELEIENLRVEYLASEELRRAEWERKRSFESEFLRTRHEAASDFLRTKELALRSSQEKRLAELHERVRERSRKESQLIGRRRLSRTRR
jgi:hypothetical protein